MEFFGVVGEKLSHTLSPEINKRIFELIDVEAAYKTFEIPKNDISKLGDALKLLNIKGVNITIPYKEAVMKQLDYISKEAKEIGAVNTILFEEGKLKGYNSDYFGFKKTLEINNIEVKNKICVVLGTGGASKALVTCLKDSKVKELYVVTRNKNKEFKINSNVKIIDYKELENIKGDFIVNATPVGMYPKVGKSPVGKEIIENFDTLVDIVYNPKMTEFLKIGESLGKKICGGLYMLVGQAVKSEEIWHKRDIDLEVLDKIYKELENRFE